MHPMRGIRDADGRRFAPLGGRNATVDFIGMLSLAIRRVNGERVLM